MQRLINFDGYVGSPFSKLTNTGSFRSDQYIDVPDQENGVKNLGIV